MTRAKLAGIFVGGASSRMGKPKGLVSFEGRTLIERAHEALSWATDDIVLVGKMPEYDLFGIAAIEDAAQDAGPLAGLVSLLRRAGDGQVIALACDMPYVDIELLTAIVAAPAAPIVAPRRAHLWEPLVARYDARAVLPIAEARLAKGEGSLQGLLEAAGAVAIEVDDQKLRDWDGRKDVEGRTAALQVGTFSSGDFAGRDDRVSIEDPLEIRVREGLNERPISITMRTPGDDIELAIGFLVGEGILRSHDDVARVETAPPSTVIISIAEGKEIDHARLERSFYTTSSCGVCGKGSLAALRATLPTERVQTARIDARTLLSLPETLRKEQAVFAETGGLHAAALFDTEGRLLSLREDVGRHNAVDKLLGGEWMAHRSPLGGRVLMLSGRAAFELVSKAAVSGVSIIAAVGAPSSLAVELAKEVGIVLVGFLRGDRFNVYAGRESVSS